MGFQISFADLRKPLTINTFMVLPKVAYALFFSFYAVADSFNTSFLTDIGLTPKQSGFIQGLRSTTDITGGFILSMTADRTRCHRAIYIIAFLGTMGALLCMPWVAQKFNESVCENMTSKLNSSLDMQKNKAYNCTSQNVERHDSLYTVMLCLNLLASFFSGPGIGFVDAAAMLHVTKSPKKAKISQQLRFASLGWALGPATVGLLVKYLSFATLSKYTPMFFVMAGSLLVTVIALYVMQGKHQRAEVDKSNRVKRVAVAIVWHRSVPVERERIGSFFRRFLRVLNDRHVVFFYLVIFILATSTGIQGSFLLIFLSDLGSSSVNQGLALFSEAGTEFLLYGVVPRIIVKVGGNIPTLALSCFIYAVRALAISFLANPWFALLVLGLTSLFQPLFFTAMLQTTARICPEGLEATMFGLSDSTIAAGLMVGSTVGGVLFEAYGGRCLFQITSAHMGLWFFVVLAYARYSATELTPCCDKRSNKSVANSAYDNGACESDMDAAGSP